MNPRLNRAARAWLPPAVAEALRRASARVTPPVWEYVADGWRADDPRARGWDTEGIVELQRRRWPSFLRSLGGTGPLGVAHEAERTNRSDLGAHNSLMCFAYALALAAAGRSKLSLLDWGGGVGHYGAISRVLLPRVDVEYHCRDLPLFCRAGRDLFPQGTFHEREEECLARRYDLVLASSSLQYSQDWQRVAGRLARASGSYLLITRLPVVERVPSFVVVQRPRDLGYPTEYLGWFLNRGEMIRAVEAEGVALVREFLIAEWPWVYRAPEQGDYRGFLFRRDASGEAGR